MNDCLDRFKEEARALARNKLPLFYSQFPNELHCAREMFFDHPLILRCQEDALPFLNDTAGHGIQHAKNVAIETGAIILIDGTRKDLKTTRHLALLGQISGLLHDTCRLEDDHARVGADLSRIILRDYPLSDRDKEMIYFAICNHEAFQPVDPPQDGETQLLSAALYDADKFRWGPDNFSTLLWEMCDYQEWPLPEVIARFPLGMKRLREILPTFRTEVGRSFGPEFIEIGLELGQTIYRRVQEFGTKQDRSQPN
ncbi:MAG: hypothetical protein ACOC24_05060 [Desulfovibrionales bacterium]